MTWGSPLLSDLHRRRIDIHKWLSIQHLHSWVVSLPSFLSLSERLGLDKEVGEGLDDDGGFRMEDEDVEAEADVAEDDAFLSDLVGAGLLEWDFSR